MKRLMMFIFVCLAISLGAQISDPEALEYQFDLTEVSHHLVTGTLSMRNPTVYTWTYTLPTSTIAEIQIDGYGPVVAYLPILMPVTINAGETITTNVGYYSDIPLSLGVHTVRAALVIGNGYPVGNTEVIYNLQPMNEVSELNWDLQLGEVYADSLTATFSFTNPSAQLWCHEYYAVPLFYLHVDGNFNGDFMYFDYPQVNVVNPGETVVLELTYRNYIQNTLTEFTPGTHVLQAFTRYPPPQFIAQTLSFTYVPSSNNDELTSPPVLSAYPNPFGSGTNIKLVNSSEQSTKLEIFNLRGQLIRTISTTRGQDSYWDGKDNQGNTTAPGVYLINMPGKAQTQALKLLKLN